MSHTEQVIELTLQVHTSDESAAARVAEILARTALGISAEGVEVSTHVDRFEQHCHHPDHDEDEVAS